MTTAHDSFLLAGFSLHDVKMQTAKKIITYFRIILFIGKVEEY